MIGSTPTRSYTPGDLNLQTITPFLWFNDNAQQAIELYQCAFADTEVINRHTAGPAETDPLVMATVRLAGLEMTVLNGGPAYTFTPAVSYFVTCPAPNDVDAIWEALSDGGSELMELGEYPFSKRYGWLADRFGVSWQIGVGPGPQSITPFLMFVGDQHGRAQEAMNLYTSVLPRSEIDAAALWQPGMPEPAGTVMYATFNLMGWRFMAMDSAQNHRFTFSPANSFMVMCGNQAEVDRYWDGLLAGGGEPSQCGWLKDRFGVSWQIIPRQLGHLMGDPDPARAGRVRKAMLGMGKIDIVGLERARAG
jgi:predicted 3-demethylubiquinone-9 3-methyltransferase (glyoxalase superfamily)